MVFINEIKLPNNVQVTRQNHLLLFEGPLGINKISFEKIDTKGIGSIQITRGSTPGGSNINKPQVKIIVSSASKSFCGLVCTIIKNKIKGVSRGFLTYLRV